MDDWRNLAACRGMGPDLFFPERGDTYAAQDAQTVCRGCPVRTDCLEYATTNDLEIGVWGGLTGRGLQRAKHRRKLGLPDLHQQPPRPRRGPKLKPIEHGTTGGYRTHLRRKITPCDECRAAWKRYEHTRRETLKQLAQTTPETNTP